ncbi:hypothetical protein G6Z25_02345 [Clostridium perfringens]|uniref:hypothetical protein n=1 Tax=Clostridium perfringens TaxID=1502 RepID=UPI0013E362DB|nr:hypothetical protein [Clostridium perfringens]NGS95760.1 hypothetical protein [Clostridium perfringens]
MPRKKTHEEFVREIKKKYGNEYEILGKYVNSHTKIKVRHNCKKCNYYEWSITPNKLLVGRSCPVCGGTMKKTSKRFKQEIKEIWGNEYEVLDEYKNAKTKILVRHNCGYEYKVNPFSLLRKNGCPMCAGKLKKTTKKFKEEIYEKYGDEYEVLGKYVNTNTKILVRHNCKKCNYHEWEIRASSLLGGQGCPICLGTTVKIGINTIWDTDRWMCDLGVSEEDAKKYGRCSHKKITTICPDCGREKSTRICDIYYNKSISCSCGDGKSYPEKFIVNLLEQLKIKYKKEYNPSYIKPKRYDFYIKDNDCIIETHGRQHYKEYTFDYCGGRSFEEEQLNDKYKREVALSNGIKYYIELDCRKSEMDYIKNSVLNSELNDLFDLSDIDWNKCAEFANKNIIKEICDYWNNKRNSETTTDLIKKFKLDRTTIITYLKKGTKLGWCNYDPSNERIRGSKKGTLLLKRKFSRKVEVFKDNKSLGIFSSCAELERQSEKLFEVKLNNSRISSVCRGKRKSHKGFTFKYIEEDNNLNI